MQLVVAAGKGHVVSLAELIAEVVAGAALQGLAVLHHGFDGIGSLRTGELLLIGLAALDNRDGQVLLADVCVAVQLLLGLSLSLAAVSWMVWPSCHQNSRLRRKGRVVFSQRTTLHHWLYFMGSSR